MSQFEVKVCRLEIVPHPNADNIELAKVGGYVSIVKKGDFKTGDLGVYIPEQALVPQRFLKVMGLEGKLAGPEKNRVKAIKLRGVLSQGLIYPVRKSDLYNYKNPHHLPWMVEIHEGVGHNKYLIDSWYVNEGENIAELLGITKWEPVVPQHMKGKAVGVALEITVNYDIENIKKHNTVFKEGEFVSITEKIHGTFVQLGYIPTRLFKPCLHMGCYTVTSKGLGSKGILLDFADELNVYARVANDKHYGLGAKLPCIKAEYQEIVGDNPIYICGEIYGPGIQSGFGYGLTGNQVGFRVFDIAYGERSNLKYFDFNTLFRICKDYEIPMVPVLYVGPFTQKILDLCTTAAEGVSGKHMHMREGVVVKPLKERYDTKAGRVILKNVAEQYLLRQGKATEYQ